MRFELVHTEMNTRFQSMNDKFDTLDRDVQALAAKVFREDRP